LARTSARFLLLLAGLGACGGDDDDATCGVADPAPDHGLIVSVGALGFDYGNFTAGQNNDCPSATPNAPTSVTIGAEQVGTGFAFSLCLPRPDLLTGAISLADPTLVQVVDVSAQGAGCTYSKNAAAIPSGTVTFVGYCSAAGTVFDMTLAGAVDGTQVCGAEQTPVSMVLAGTVSIVSQ
jgi:hypothetical protein